MEELTDEVMEKEVFQYVHARYPGLRESNINRIKGWSDVYQIDLQLLSIRLEKYPDAALLLFKGYEVISRHGSDTPYIRLERPSSNPDNPFSLNPLLKTELKNQSELKNELDKIFSTGAPIPQRLTGEYIANEICYYFVDKYTQYGIVQPQDSVQGADGKYHLPFNGQLCSPVIPEATELTFEGSPLHTTDAHIFLSDAAQAQLSTLDDLKAFLAEYFPFPKTSRKYDGAMTGQEASDFALQLVVRLRKKVNLNDPSTDIDALHTAIVNKLDPAILRALRDARKPYVQSMADLMRAMDRISCHCERPATTRNTLEEPSLCN